MRVPFMKTWLVLTALAAALAGCSGGGPNGCSSSVTPIGGAASGSSGCQTTPVDTTPTAADLIVTVTTSKPSGIQNTGADTATLTVTAVDTNRNVVADVPVTISPDATAIVTPSGTTTDLSGIVTGVIALGNDHSNRMIAVSVTSGSITKAVNIPVTGAQLSSTVPSQVAPGSSNTIQYRLVDAVGTAISGATITVTGTFPTSGTTDANGSFTYAFTAPAGAGQIEFDAAAAGVTKTDTVINATTTIPPAIGPVISATLQVTPATIGINANGSTSNAVDVRAEFLTSNNLPIQNVRVRFDLFGDQNSIGGSLVSGPDIIVYSDSLGIARTSYVAGARSSGNQALTIRGCWSITDFAEVTPPGADCPNGQAISQDITVADEAVSITITYDGLLSLAKLANGQDDATTLQQAYTVQVTDSNANPKAGVKVTGTAYLPRYYLGELAYGSNNEWGYIFPKQACNNENINRNTVIDVYSTTDPTQTEDANGNGVLDPAASDVLLTPQSAGSDVTDEFGRAHFFMQYGRNHALWDDFELTFAASVAGSEGRKTLAGTFFALASDITDSGTPAFQVSPYGTNVLTVHHTGGADTYTQLIAVPYPVTDPSTGTTVSLCPAPK